MLPSKGVNSAWLMSHMQQEAQLQKHKLTATSLTWLCPLLWTWCRLSGVDFFGTVDSAQKRNVGFCLSLKAGAVVFVDLLVTLATFGHGVDCI